MHYTVYQQKINKKTQNREIHFYDLKIHIWMCSLSHTQDIVALQADKSSLQLKSTPTSHAVCVRGPAYPSTLSLPLSRSLSLVISLGVFGQQIHKSIMVLSFMPWFTQLISPGLQRSLKTCQSALKLQVALTFIALLPRRSPSIDLRAFWTRCFLITQWRSSLKIKLSFLWMLTLESKFVKPVKD